MKLRKKPKNHRKLKKRVFRTLLIFECFPGHHRNNDEFFQDPHLSTV